MRRRSFPDGGHGLFDGALSETIGGVLFLFIPLRQDSLGERCLRFALPRTVNLSFTTQILE